MVLVDTLDEQALLEQLLEGSKPPLPSGAAGLHWLLFTPFRYPPPPSGSRFRGQTDPGVFYGADEVETACAELGFWRHDGSFNVVSRSREATTPADAVSPDTTARFVTIPLDISFAELLKMVQSHAIAGAQLADVLHELQTRGFKFPFKVGVDLGPWSAAQTAELERLLGGDVLR